MKAVVYHKRSTSEHQLQTLVLEHLRLRAVPNAFWFAIPNAARRTFGTASRMKAEGLTAGIADICIMLEGGRTLWLELKSGKGRQSDHQKGFQAICDRLGHTYLLARSLDEVIGQLKAFGALK